MGTVPGYDVRGHGISNRMTTLPYSSTHGTLTTNANTHGEVAKIQPTWFSCNKNKQVNLVENLELKIIRFETHKHCYQIHTLRELEIGHCHLCIEVHLKLRLQSL